MRLGKKIKLYSSFYFWFCANLTSMALFVICINVSLLLFKPILVWSFLKRLLHKMSNPSINFTTWRLCLVNKTTKWSVLDLIDCFNEHWYKIGIVWLTNASCSWIGWSAPVWTAGHVFDWPIVCAFLQRKKAKHACLLHARTPSYFGQTSSVDGSFQLYYSVLYFLLNFIF